MSDTISDTIKVDTARLPLLLNELRLPTITALWPAFTERADREGWPAARLLAALAELGVGRAFSVTHSASPDRGSAITGQDVRSSIDFAALPPMISRAHVSALASVAGRPRVPHKTPRKRSRGQPQSRPTSSTR